MASSLCHTLHYSATCRFRQITGVDLFMNKPNVPSDAFPERLRIARKLRDLEQLELAIKAGLPSTSISHFEGGTRKPSFDNLRRLAHALDVTADYLLGRTDKPEMSQATTDQLYRDMEKLTAEDQVLAKNFLALLANRKKSDERT